jgi:hypothetical protein
MERTQRSPEHARRSRLPLFVLVLPLLLGAVAEVDENHAAVFGIEASPCPLRLLAGERACPGCGLTRGTALAVQGEWSRAWNVQPAGIVVAALCALGLALRCWTRVDPHRTRLQAALLRRGPVLFTLGILAAWVVRLVR